MNINKHWSDFIKVRDRLIKEFKYPDTGGTDALAVALYHAMATAEISETIHDTSPPEN